MAAAVGEEDCLISFEILSIDPLLNGQPQVLKLLDGAGCLKFCHVTAERSREVRR
jgi:hypothetical protein